jgi:hypothetical protein
MPSITIMSGAALGFDAPAACHSGKPDATRCTATTEHPGREGWRLIKNPAERRRNGWWCPDCVNQLEGLIRARRWKLTRRDVSLPPEGRA